MRRHAHTHLAAAVVPASVAQGHIRYDEQRIRHPIDAPHARERVVDRRGECTIAISTIWAMPNSQSCFRMRCRPIPTCCSMNASKIGAAVGRPDTREWLAPQYKLSRSVKEVNDGVRPQGRGHQSRTVDLLNVTAMLALDGLPFGYLLLDDRQRRLRHFPVECACVRLDYRWLQVIDDARDYVRILYGSGNAMAEIDEEGKTCDHKEPARDQRDLRDKGRVRVLIGHQKDQTQVDERGHERHRWWLV